MSKLADRRDSSLSQSKELRSGKYPKAQVAGSRVFSDTTNGNSLINMSRRTLTPDTYAGEMTRGNNSKVFIRQNSSRKQLPMNGLSIT